MFASLATDRALKALIILSGESKDGDIDSYDSWDYRNAAGVTAFSYGKSAGFGTFIFSSSLSFLLTGYRSMLEVLFSLTTLMISFGLIFFSGGLTLSIIASRAAFLVTRFDLMG